MRLKFRSGFTLVELLVVIAIIGILVAMLLPAVQSAREASRRTQCVNHLKQFALGVHNFESVHNQIPRGNYVGGTFPMGGNTSWMFVTLGFMEQGNLYDRAVGSGSLANAVAQNILPARVPIVRCPSDQFDRGDLRLSNYVGSTGPTCNNPPAGCPAPFQIHCNGQIDSGMTIPPALSPPTHPGYPPSMTWGNSAVTGETVGLFARGGALIRLADVTDGTSNTILLGETLPEYCEFMRYNSGKAGWAEDNFIAQGQTIQPINWKIDRMRTFPPAFTSCGCDSNSNPSGDPARCIMNWAVTWGFKSLHPGGANFALTDGSVQYYTSNINMRSYQYLGCRNDGQTSAP